MNTGPHIPNGGAHRSAATETLVAIPLGGSKLGRPQAVL